VPPARAGARPRLVATRPLESERVVTAQRVSSFAGRSVLRARPGASPVRA